LLIKIAIFLTGKFNSFLRYETKDSRILKFCFLKIESGRIKVGVEILEIMTSL